MLKKGIIPTILFIMVILGCIIVTIKNTDEAIGDDEKSATNKEHRKEAKIETDAIANSKHKSDVLLLHNSSISSFVTS